MASQGYRLSHLVGCCILQNKYFYEGLEKDDHLKMKKRFVGGMTIVRRG
jgi:hypothetical protein